MDPVIWLICGLFVVWGLGCLIYGIVRNVRHQVLSGVAVILLAGSMPLLYESNWLGWLLVAVAVPLAVASIVMRFREISGRR